MGEKEPNDDDDDDVYINKIKTYSTHRNSHTKNADQPKSQKYRK
jgi:hypothetical protein